MAENLGENPIVQMDYSQLGDRWILTAYSCEKGAGNATMIPSKSVSAWQVAWMCRTLQWMGHSEVTLQCDQEPTIRALADRVVARRRDRALVRQVPRRSHQSLGADERWNQSVQGQFRVIKMQLEEQAGTLFTANSAVCSWAVRHSAWLLTRFQVSRLRGGTAFWRVRNATYTAKSPTSERK